MSKKKLAGIVGGCAVTAIVAIVMATSNGGYQPPPPPSYTLDVSVNPSEGGSVFPPGGEYEFGVQVTLIASPTSGYTFDYWSGDVSDTTSTITITMDSDKSLTAHFKADPTPAPPSVTIALDYFGVRNTHWEDLFMGEDKARIQLVVLVRDEQKNLATLTIPPEGIQGFSMDFFQVNALKDNMDPRIFTGTPTGSSLTFAVSAYNVDKGPITKAQIDVISTWLGMDFSLLKDLVPDKELVGQWWRTWSASENFGIGGNYILDDGNLKVWLRIGSNQTMPNPVPRPVLRPNVEIVGELPIGVRVRQPSEWPLPKCWPFKFTIANKEPFAFHIYWRLETDSDPRTDCGAYGVSRTEGKLSVPGGGSVTKTYRYWFDTPGTYRWKYVAECPKGSPVASWEGTLTVAP